MLVSALGKVIEAVAGFNRSVEAQVAKARREARFAAQLRRRLAEIRSHIPTVETPTGLKLPRLALPHLDEAGAIARYLFGEGLPGEFPFVNAAYRKMYLEKTEIGKQKAEIEEPTRLFAGLGLAAEPD